MVKNIFVTVIVACIIVGCSSTSLAESAFETSDKRCKSNEISSCISIPAGENNGKVVTVGKLLKDLHIPISQLLKVNDWAEGSVTNETVIPFDKEFAIR